MKENLYWLGLLCGAYSIIGGLLCIIADAIYYSNQLAGMSINLLFVRFQLTLSGWGFLLILIGIVLNILAVAGRIVSTARGPTNNK